MKLPVVPVHSFEDATLDFEKLQTLGVLGSIVAGDVQVAAGTATVVWPGGSANSNTTTVVHGLGRSPKVVLALPDDSGTFRFSKLACTLRTASQVSFQAQTGDLSSPAASTTIGFDWLAVG